jgi:hypothetical protein
VHDISESSQSHHVKGRVGLFLCAPSASHTGFSVIDPDQYADDERHQDDDYQSLDTQVDKHIVSFCGS